LVVPKPGSGTRQPLAIVHAWAAQDPQRRLACPCNAQQRQPGQPPPNVDPGMPEIDAERAALRQQLASRDDAIVARQSLRWWLSLPLHRLRLWLNGR